jgi:hypothetical protein
MVAAANSLAGGTGQEFTNGDLFASNMIVARHILAGSITAAEITVLDLEALNATIGGITIDTNSMYIGTGNHGNVNTPFYVDDTGDFSLGNAFVWDQSATTLAVTGEITGEAFTLISGATTVSSLYSSDTSYERLRMFTNQASAAYFDLGWASTGGDGAFDECFLKFNMPANPSQLQLVDATGLHFGSNLVNDFVKLTAGDASLNLGSVGGGTASLVGQNGNAIINVTSLGVGLYGTTTINDDTYIIGDLSLDGSARASTSFLVGASGDDGIGPVTGAYGSVQTVGSGMNGYEGYSIDGRVVFMHDGSIHSGIYDNVNLQWILYGQLGGATDIRHANVARVTTSSTGATINGALEVSGRAYVNQNYGGVSWSGMQFLIQSADTSTSNNKTVGMALHNKRYSIAPLIRNYGPYGESVDFTNNPGNAFIPIRASAFQVNSTIRVKDDIRAVEDADAIKMAEDFLLVSYMPKVRPQTMRPTERFNRIDAKWQASGRPPLEVLSTHTEAHDHDCSIDNCDGLLGSECPITANDSRVYSGLAEWTGETNPEIAFFDEGGIAEGLDVAQIASSALGAAGSVSRKLTAALEVLEARLAVLEDDAAKRVKELKAPK